MCVCTLASYTDCIGERRRGLLEIVRKEINLGRGKERERIKTKVLEAREEERDGKNKTMRDRLGSLQWESF